MTNLEKINQIRADEEFIKKIPEKENTELDQAVQDSEIENEGHNSFMRNLKKLLSKIKKPRTPNEETIVISEEREKESFFSKKTALVASCVLLIAVASYLNIRFAGEETDVAAPEDSNTLGSASLVDNTALTGEEDYFALAVINRQRVRDEAIEMLENVTASTETDAVAKESAYLEMTKIAGEINSEANIENLVKAKGFEACVAVVSGENANIIVECDELGVNQVAQIKEIVYLEAGVLPENIKIIEKS